MNLIEQLGGYEKAKQKAENALANQVTRISYKTKLYINGEETEVVTGAYVRDIKKALLEYRREHNIFEVGDLIMYENKMYEIKYIYHPEKARITDGLQGRTVYDFPRGIKHATDEEIKANRKLEG